MKIVYCTDSICYSGGIQRITIAKANALADIEGNEVWLVVTDNKRPIPVLPVSEKIHLVDLDVNYYEDDWKSKLHILKGIFVKRKLHQKKLKELFNFILPDVVISTGTSEKNFLPRIKVSSKPVFIREIHFPVNYRRLTAKGRYDKLLAWVGDFVDYRVFIRRYDKIVVLTHEDKKKQWNYNHKVIVTPNPLTVKHDRRSMLNNKTVITVGRLVSVKNYSSLIRIWAMVHELHQDWTLEIWGDGGEEEMLRQQIKDYHLEKTAYLMGYTDDVITRLAASSIFVLTSEYEGFGLVILEAMSCGLPIVSYECPCGPKDIIIDGVDGFLVSLNDENKMTEHICYLIEHEDARFQMGKAAFEKSKQYAMNVIIEKWMNLFEELKRTK